MTTVLTQLPVREGNAQHYTDSHQRPIINMKFRYYLVPVSRELAF